MRLEEVSFSFAGKNTVTNESKKGVKEMKNMPFVQFVEFIYVKMKNRGEQLCKSTDREKITAEDFQPVEKECINSSANTLYNKATSKVMLWPQQRQID